MTTWTAAVCKRGHVISGAVFDITQRLESPNRTTGYTKSIYARDFQGERGPVDGQRVARFCGSCSAPVILQCEACAYPIAAPDYYPSDFDPDAFCRGCSLPFPWASREKRIEQIGALLEFETGLTDADRLALIEEIAVLSVPEDAADHPRQVRAIEKLKRLAPTAWLTIQPIIIATLSGEVRKQLNLPPG